MIRLSKLHELRDEMDWQENISSLPEGYLVPALACAGVLIISVTLIALFLLKG